MFFSEEKNQKVITHPHEPFENSSLRHKPKISRQAKPQ
jgi:hypothetical protein